MEPDCPHLSLAQHSAGEDADKSIALVDSLDALRLCGEGSFEAVSASDALWDFERESPQLSLELLDFAVRIGLASPFWGGCDGGDLAELIGDGIKRGDLVGLRQLSAAASKPTLEQRHLVAEIEAKTRGRLQLGGRQYKLVAGDDLNGMPDRNSYEVVPREDARRTLDRLAKEPSVAAAVATLLGKARDKLTPDWRPPLAPDGLILLRRSSIARVHSSEAGPALTPSQIKKLAAKDWIEIEVVDQDGEPLSTMHYRLELADASVHEGELDDEGSMAVYEIEFGNCKLVVGEVKLAPEVAEEVLEEAPEETPEEEPVSAEETLPPESAELTEEEPTAAAAVADAEAVPETQPVLLRLHMDPAEAAKMKESFRLFSVDGSYERNEAADRVPGNDYLDLLYEGVPTDLIYSLEVTGPGITPYFLFQEVPFSQLNGFH